VASFVGSEVVDMVTRSGPVGKTVLAILLLFSLYSWTVIYAKWRSFGRARRESERFLRAFRKSQRLSEVAAVLDHFRFAPLAAVFQAGLDEVEQQLSGGNPGRLSSSTAVQRALQIACNEQVAEMERLLSGLATTATTTPFIGLFGTVWGVMDAFHGLGTASGANLRVVAPGISEALIATAAGLFAAIPAVIFYNHFLHQLRQFAGRMDNFALEFLNLAERYHS
jgi:biopolymer transport protein TolQ